MKKRLLLVLIVALGMACVVILFYRNREPTYESRTVSDWFNQYCQSRIGGQWDEDARDEAAEAFRQMGANSLHYLVEQCLNTHRDSAFKTNFYRFANTIWPWGRRAFIGVEEKREEAGDAIRALKPPAKAILSLLTNALNGRNELLRREAIILLGRVGDDAEEAVPYLVKALGETNHWERVLAAQSLSWLDSRARPALPALLEALEDPSCPPQAILAIGNLGSAAKGAIPQLQRRLVSSKQWERLYSAVALCRIDLQQTQAVDLLMKGIQSKTNSKYRKDILWVVKDLKSDGKFFVPALLEAAHDSNDAVSIPAVSALQNIAPEEAIQVLLEKLNSPNQQTNVRLWAAAWLLRINAKQQQSLSVLIDSLNDPTWRHYAIQSLGEASPDAKAVVAALQKIANEDKDKNARDLARKALKKIKRKAVEPNATDKPK